MHELKDADILALLAAHVAEHGVRGTARAWGLSPTLISQAMLGKERISPAIAERLGYQDDGRRWVPSGRPFPKRKRK